MSTLADATDDIVLVKHLQQTRDITGIVLQIGIQGDHHSATYLFEASIQRGALSSVTPEADAAHFWVLGRELCQYLRRLICTAVIHKEELIGQLECGKCFGNRRGEGDQTVLFVIGGDDYGNFWGG